MSQKVLKNIDCNRSIKDTQKGGNATLRAKTVKVLIRHLPPSITEEELIQQIQPIPNYVMLWFCKADWSLGVNATSRAYILFEKSPAILDFRNRLDGYVFIDAKGTDYQAIVEYAPFNGFVRNYSKKEDTEAGTIEQDEFYTNFLAHLVEVSDRPASKNDTNSASATEPKDGITPLLKYLEEKNDRIRDAIRKKNDKRHRLPHNQHNQHTSADNFASGSEKPSRLQRRAERNHRRRELYEERKMNKLQKEDLPTEKKFQTNIIKRANGNNENSKAPDSSVNTTSETAKKSEKSEKHARSNAASNKELNIKSSDHVSKHKHAKHPEEHRIRNKDRPSIAIYEPKKRHNQDTDKRDAQANAAKPKN